MWTRKELKERGKAAFKANYWRCVLVSLILLLIGGGVGAASSSYSSHSIQNQIEYTQPAETAGQSVDSITGEDELDSILGEFGQMSKGAQMAVASIIFMTILIITAVAMVISIFLLNPLVLGCQRFFSENSRYPAELGEVGFGFEHGYSRVVKTMFLTDLFLILWTCLFFIPGIIKSYSYRMVPYILAQEPELSGREVIDRSRQMMNGHKWKAFVLDLSFILWYLLAVITLGLAGIFYVNPYVDATNAELYHELIREETGDYGSGYIAGDY